MAFRVLCLLAVGAAAAKQSPDLAAAAGSVGAQDEVEAAMAQAVVAQHAQETVKPEEGFDQELEKAERDPLFQVKNPLLDWFKNRRAMRANSGRNPNNPIAQLNTNMGTIEIELYLDKAPITVSNFIDLSRTGFYNGLHFHRVIPVFMDQFGCPFSKDPKDDRAGTGGPVPHTSFINFGTKKNVTRDQHGNIPDECPGVSNEAGTIAMANTGADQSGGSQFFINMANNDNLDCFDKNTASKHPVFGRITEGYRVAAAISRVKTKGDKPIKPIKMLSIGISGAAVTPAKAPAKTPAKPPAKR